jgi:hypothetical protein
MKAFIYASRFVLVLTVHFISISAFSKTDTVFISHQTTTYLLFAQAVEVVDVGMTHQYYVKIEGKAVFIKAKKAQTSSTSIFIKHGEEYFTAFLAFQASPKQILYDYRRNDTLTVSIQNNLTTTITKLDTLAIQKRLTTWSASPKGVKKKKVKKGELSLSLCHIQNDKEATYLNFTLANTSTIDYQIDLVSFERKERRGKRFSKNNINSLLIKPIKAAPEMGSIEAKKTSNLFYAIPLYAIGPRGRLTITFREKSGSRIISISLPAGFITNAALYEPLSNPITSYSFN